MKKTSRLFCLALALCMLLLAACASNGGTPATAKPADPTAAPTAASGGTPTEKPADPTPEPPAPQEDKHLNVAIYWNPNVDTMNSWGGWWTMRYGIGETLLTMDANMQLVENLADSWELVDQQTYKFHIRKGVKFSNGNDLTPQTVADSITRIAEGNSRGGNLKLAGAEVDGEYVIFRTTEPYSAFPYMITEPMCIIVDTTQDMSIYDIYPVCTGPYKVIDYVADEKWELEANEYYWKGTPAIKYITNYNIGSDTRMDALLAGEIDMAYQPDPSSLVKIQGNPKYEVVSAVGTRVNSIIFNCDPERPLGDVNLRQALCWSVQRDVLAQIKGNGTAEPCCLNFPDSAGYDLTSVQGPGFDLDKARDYLAKAGYADSDNNGYVDKDGQELVLKFSLSSSTSSVNTAVYTAMQDMWKTLGVHVELEMLENISEKRKSGDFDILSDGWQTMNNGDGQSCLKNRWGTGAPDNYFNYSSPEFDAYMDRMDSTFDPAERAKIFTEVTQFIADEALDLVYAATANYHVINADVMDDFTIYPLDYYVIDYTWSMK